MGRASLAQQSRACVHYGLWLGSQVQILAKACAFFENGELSCLLQHMTINKQLAM